MFKTNQSTISEAYLHVRKLVIHYHLAAVAIIVLRVANLRPRRAPRARPAAPRRRSSAASTRGRGSGGGGGGSGPLTPVRGRTTASSCCGYGSSLGSGGGRLSVAGVLEIVVVVVAVVLVAVGEVVGGRLFCFSQQRFCTSLVLRNRPKRKEKKGKNKYPYSSLVQKQSRAPTDFQRSIISITKHGGNLASKYFISANIYLYLWGYLLMLNASGRVPHPGSSSS